MAGYRQSRINQEIANELAIAMRGVKDPRIINSFVSVMEVDCSKDLKNAKVYYSFLPGKANGEEISKILKGASGFLRSHLAKTLNLRETPELTFIFDESVERGNRISSILHEVSKEIEKNDKRQE